MKATNIHIFNKFKAEWLSDIRFWIIVFFILRLYGISDPPIEMAHNWRQAFTNIVARNFLEIDSSIFYPRAVIYGNNSGIVGTEFPLLNYLIFLVSKFLGYAHWHGRFINLIVSSVGLYYFYLGIRDFVSKKLCFNATIVLMCSIWFIFSRKSMPDTFSISVLLIGLYYGLSYFKQNEFKYLLLFFIFTSLGILCKIPGLYLLCIFVIPVFKQGLLKKETIYFLLATMIVLALVYIWYFRWVPYLESIDGNRLYFPKSLSEGMKEVFDKSALLAERFYFSSLQSFVSFFMFLVGLFFMFWYKQKEALLVFILLSSVFFIFILKTGEVFPLHSYYVIPFSPVMAVFVAYGLNQLKKQQIRLIVLSLIVVESIANQQDDFRLKQSELYKLNLEQIANKFSEKDELIAINSGESPQELYLAHRNGWRLTEEQAVDEDYLTLLSKKGCKYLFLNKHKQENRIELKKFELAYEDINYKVYKLF